MFAIYAQTNRELQMLVVVLTTVCYVALGILHHVLHHDFSIKIMVEYILMGALGMTIVLFILRGGII